VSFEVLGAPKEFTDMAKQGSGAPTRPCARFSTGFYAVLFLQKITGAKEISGMSNVFAAATGFTTASLKSIVAVMLLSAI